MARPTDADKEYAAEVAAKLEEIKAHPELHRHTYDQLMECCATIRGIDSQLMDAHSGLCGHNGGQGCDTIQGPCSCGAWHEVEDGMPAPMPNLAVDGETPREN